MTAARVLEYLDRSGRSPWRRWFNDLDAIAAAKVGTALYRLSQGNFKQRKKGAAKEQSWH